MKQILFSCLRFANLAYMGFSDLRQWEKIRAQGSARFIFSRTIVMTCWWSAFIGSSFYIWGDPISFSPKGILILFGCSYPMGLISAFGAWGDCEAWYLKKRNEESKHAEPENTSNTAKA